MRYVTRILLATALFSIAANRSSAVESIPPGEKLMPNTTQGFLSVTNVDALIDHYNKTQLGKMTADPVMEPFTKDIRRQFESRWSGVHMRLGLTLEDLRDVPGGEVCIGLIEPEKETSALAVIIDVTGKHKEAAELVERITKNVTMQGAKRSTLKVDESPEPLIKFDLPIPEEEKEAATSKLDGVKKPAGKEKDSTKATEDHVAYYSFHENLLVAADDLAVIRGVLSRAKAGKGKCLADIIGFQKVMERCLKDSGDPSPQIRWYVNPIGYASAARAATPEAKRRKGKSLLDIMRNQGFGAIKGVGGYASFSAEGFDLVHRTAVYAPMPYEKSMKMLKFVNGKDYAPQAWVPRDVATYSSVYFDIMNAFDNFGPMFDELYGAGEEGYWKDALRGLEEDPSGPQINLREELIEYFGTRISLVTDYELPITTGSERVVVAIESKNDEALAKGIRKVISNEPDWKERDIDGLIVWEKVEEKPQEMGDIDISFGADEATTPPPTKKTSKREEGPQPLFPHAAITVTRGQFFLASHLDFLQKVLKDHEKGKLLIDDPDYQIVKKAIDALPLQDKCARFYSRTDEEFRPTYELIRQNKMPESETMLGRLLNALFGDQENAKKHVTREARLDGSKLPEYDSVRKYFNPAGFQATAEDDGWFLKGFTLTEGSPNRTPEATEDAAKESEKQEQAKKAEEKKDEKKAELKSGEGLKIEKKESAKPTEKKPAETKPAAKK